MIAIGPERFREMLAGFHAMDEHFRTAPFERNLPVLLGAARRLVQQLLRRRDARRAALQPVPRALPRLPPAARHGEQRQVASTLDGRPVDDPDRARSCGASPAPTASTPIYQLIHQGTKLIPVRLHRLRADAQPRLGDHHDLLMANFFAQTEALAFGKTERGGRGRGRGPGSRCRTARSEGNRPTNTLLAERLTPHVLGQLVALYEHKVFMQGAIWDINSFDQWGVELGKVLAHADRARARAAAEPALEHDSSTNALIRRYRRLRRG